MLLLVVVYFVFEKRRTNATVSTPPVWNGSLVHTCFSLAHCVWLRIHSAEGCVHAHTSDDIDTNDPSRAQQAGAFHNPRPCQTRWATLWAWGNDCYRLLTHVA